MEKRNKKTGGSRNGNNKLHPRDRNELTNIVEELLKRCTREGPIDGYTALQMWSDYSEIYKLVEDIREREQGIVLPQENRGKHIQSFKKWLINNGGQLNDVDIVEYDTEGFGLKATASISHGKEVIRIPNHLMMTEQTAIKSYLGSTIEKDLLLRKMENVALALHLLGEKTLPNSFWKPYINILPNELTSVLYLTPTHLQSLKGSLLFEKSLLMFKNISRQYAYLYMIIHTTSKARDWPIRNYFTFDAYRWAASIVMTRQNRIPCPTSPDGGILALIPAWDMANHRDGELSTDFDDATKEIVCLSHDDFKKDDQFTICYGRRPNFDFFLHNGFVYSDNKYDTMTIKLGVSKNDPLYDDKCELLTMMMMPPSHDFMLASGDLPIIGPLLAFTQVFCMDKETLDVWKGTGGNYPMGPLSCSTDVKIADKVWKFLHTRIMLIQRSYPTTLEDDLQCLPELDKLDTYIRSMVITEKKILHGALKYIKKQMEEMEQ